MKSRVNRDGTCCWKQDEAWEQKVVMVERKGGE
jgi:hypothetical protein